MTISNVDLWQQVYKESSGSTESSNTTIDARKQIEIFLFNI